MHVLPAGLLIPTRKSRASYGCVNVAWADLNKWLAGAQARMLSASHWLLRNSLESFGMDEVAAHAYLLEHLPPRNTYKNLSAFGACVHSTDRLLRYSNISWHSKCA
jgi:hypothetical protein